MTTNTDRFHQWMDGPRPSVWPKPHTKRDKSDWWMVVGAAAYVGLLVVAFVVGGAVL
jgi:hypothetical protein